MPRFHTKPTIIFLEGRARPHRVTYYIDGQRKTKHFDTKRKAQSFADDQAKETRKQGPLAVSEDERLLLHRLRTAAAARGAALGKDLRELLRQIQARPADCRGPLTLADAIEEFLTDCLARNLRLHTRQHYERILSYFRKGREKIPVSSIEGALIAGWLTARYTNENSRQTARTPVMRFCRWCVERNYLAEVPVVKWRAAKSDEQRVEFLPVEQVAEFFGRLNPSYWAAAALGFFAGIRPMELQRLEWSHVNFDTRTVDVPGVVAKTRAFRRLHDLPDNLWKWLEAAPGKREGRIVPGNYRNYRWAIEDGRAGAQWPHDAMRHSFASYGYHRGLEWCIDTMGHIGGFRTFVRHYKGAADKTQSDRFFGILPPRKTAEEILQARRPRPRRRLSTQTNPETPVP